MHLISLAQQQLREVSAVLPCDAGDESLLTQIILRRLAVAPSERVHRRRCNRHVIDDSRDSSPERQRRYALGVERHHNRIPRSDGLLATHLEPPVAFASYDAA